MGNAGSEDSTTTARKSRPSYAGTRYEDPKQQRTAEKVFSEESEEDIPVNRPASSQRGKSKKDGDIIGVNRENSKDLGTEAAEGKSPTNPEGSKEGLLRSDMRILSKERSPRRDEGVIIFKGYYVYQRKVWASIGGRAIMA